MHWLASSEEDRNQYPLREIMLATPFLRGA